MVTPQKLCAQGVHMCAGSFMGIFISWVVNCTLAEISLNKFFSVYFGLLFALIGGIIIWRIRSAAHPVPDSKRPLLIGFAALVVGSGILCLLLDEHWFRFSATVKIPLYGLLGMSVCFAFTFSFLDLINWTVGTCQAEHSKPLVESAQQVNVLLVCSVLMGAIFGIIFGLMDVEDKRGLALRDSLIQEERYCLPVGIVVGGVAALWNLSLRGTAREAGYGAGRNADPFFAEGSNM